mmetsp:Transcript_33426/g.38393  ORF Transcript_33426/g.38393 Transcript_33426/m.38393 type:complete len:137 (-) Transcript_33426:41-451(-)
MSTAKQRGLKKKVLSPEVRIKVSPVKPSPLVVENYKSHFKSYDVLDDLNKDQQQLITNIKIKVGEARASRFAGFKSPSALSRTIYKSRGCSEVVEGNSFDTVEAHDENDTFSAVCSKVFSIKLSRRNQRNNNSVYR